MFALRKTKQPEKKLLDVAAGQRQDTPCTRAAWGGFLCQIRQFVKSTDANRQRINAEAKN